MTEPPTSDEQAKITRNYNSHRELIIRTLMQIIMESYSIFHTFLKMNLYKFGKHSPEEVCIPLQSYVSQISA